MFGYIYIYILIFYIYLFSAVGPVSYKSPGGGFLLPLCTRQRCTIRWPQAGRGDTTKDFTVLPIFFGEKNPQLLDLGEKHTDQLYNRSNRRDTSGSWRLYFANKYIYSYMNLTTMGPQPKQATTSVTREHVNAANTSSDSKIWSSY